MNKAMKSAPMQGQPNKVRHLDTAIEILGGGKAKRAPRKAQIELILYVDHKNGTYSITANGRPLVVDHKSADTPEGGPEEVLRRRANMLRSRGKTVSTAVF